MISKCLSKLAIFKIVITSLLIFLSFERTVPLRHVFLGIENGSNPGRIQICVSRKIKDDVGKAFAVFFDNEFFESECVF